MRKIKGNRIIKENELNNILMRNLMFLINQDCKIKLIFYNLINRQRLSDITELDQI